MLRSDAVTKGIQRSPNRAMLRAVGFGDSDFGKPILGIANGYSTITPCNVGLNDLAKRAEEAARQASESGQFLVRQRIEVQQNYREPHICCKALSGHGDGPP